MASLLQWVVAPLYLPGLLSVAIFQGIFIFNELLPALIIISDDAMKTVPLGLVAFGRREARSVLFIPDSEATAKHLIVL